MDSLPLVSYAVASSPFAVSRWAGASPVLTHRRRGLDTVHSTCYVPRKDCDQVGGRVVGIDCKSRKPLGVVSIPMDHIERIIPSSKVFSG